MAADTRSDDTVLFCESRSFFPNLRDAVIACELTHKLTFSGCISLFHMRLFPEIQCQVDFPHVHVKLELARWPAGWSGRVAVFVCVLHVALLVHAAHAAAAS